MFMYMYVNNRAVYRGFVYLVSSEGILQECEMN